MHCRQSTSTRYRIALLLQWSLLFAYFVSVAVRTLIRGRAVALFEVVQMVAALMIALVGTGILTQATGILPAAIGVISLASGLVRPHIKMLISHRGYYDSIRFSFPKAFHQQA